MPYMLSSRMSWSKIKKEIEKCVVLCTNCHGEVHEGCKVL